MIPDMLESVTKVIKEEKQPVVYADTLVDLAYELSAKYIVLWHEAGSKVIVKASTIKDAVTAEKWRQQLRLEQRQLKWVLCS